MRTVALTILALLAACSGGGGDGGGGTQNVAATWPAFIGRWTSSTSPTLVMDVSADSQQTDTFAVHSFVSSAPLTPHDGRMSIDRAGEGWHFRSADGQVTAEGEWFRQAGSPDQLVGTMTLPTLPPITGILWTRSSPAYIEAEWSWPDLAVQLRVDVGVDR